MAIDASIPLAGRFPDFGGSFRNALITGQNLREAYDTKDVRKQLMEQRAQIQEQALSNNAEDRKRMAVLGTLKALRQMDPAKRDLLAPSLENNLKEQKFMGEDDSFLDDPYQDDAWLDANITALSGESNKASPTDSQKNFEYWQNLPAGSAAWVSFGQKNGFLNTDKEALEAEKLLIELKNLEASGGSLDPEKQAEIEGKLRKEVYDRSKAFETVDDAWKRIQASASDPSPAGDLALIFNYMKVLDPGSTVREGEFANAESAGSIDKRIWATYNKVVSGERLSPSQRKDFVDRGRKLYDAAEGKNAIMNATYKALAERYNVSPGNVILDKPTLMVDANGNRAIVYPDGRIEEQ